MARTTASTTTDRLDPNLPVLILMDLSTSMGEDNGSSGESLLDAAKDAVNGFIAELPDQTAVGLDTYPHDGDCGEGTTAIPLAPSSTEEMARYVRSMSANGNTPTGLALRKAARDLEAYAGSKGGVIVLVSDGESNCEATSPPPCVVAEELASEGFDLTVNTVGLQISAEGREELQCIADATKGVYVHVDEPDKLAEALRPSGVPEISLEVSYPERVVLVPGTNDTVHLTATVTNIGQVTAPNVQATITYDAQFSPGSANPRRRLGNLAAAESVTFDWTFRPTSQFEGAVVAFEAVAVTAGMPTDPIGGSIAFEPPDSETAYPEWLAQTTDFVVLGDSYSSGEGLAPGVAEGSRIYEAGTDAPFNSCHRGKSGTYAHELAALIGKGASVHNLACSGAITWDYWADAATTRPQHGRNENEQDRLMQRVGGTKTGAPLPAQRDQLRSLLAKSSSSKRSYTFLMTIGGNDMGFEEVVKRCLNTSFVQHLMTPTPAFQIALTAVVGAAKAKVLFGIGAVMKGARGLGIYDYGTCSTHKGPEHPSGWDLVGRNLTYLATEGIPPIYEDIQSIAQAELGHAVPILVPLYPRPFPNDQNAYCRADAQATFTPEDRTFMNTTVDRMNAAVRRAVDQTRKRTKLPIWAVETIPDTFQSGHTYCDKESWINRLTLEGLLSYAGDAIVNFGADHPVLFGASATWWQKIAESTTRHGYKNMFHPNADGYKAEAVQIASWAADHGSITVSGGPSIGEPQGLEAPPSPSTVTKVSNSGSVTLSPGSSTSVQASGFAPGSLVTVDIESNPEALAIAAADAQGNIAVPATIRSDFPLGTHHLVVTGYDSKGKPVVYRMKVRVERPLPAWWLPAAGGTLGILVAAVACGVGFRRSRRRSCSDG